MRKLISFISILIIVTNLSCKEKTEPKPDLTAAKRALVSCYPFDGNANDMVGSNNGTIVGASLTEDRLGNPNSAYSFDGNDRIEITTNELINSEFTWCAWVKPVDLPRSGDAQIVLSFGSQGGDQSIALNHNYFTDTQDKSKWVLGNYIGFEKTNNFAIVDEPIEPNQWYFVTAVRSKDSLAIYLNGRLKTEIYSGGVSPYYGSLSSPRGRIGSRYTNGQNFNGVLDDIMLFKTILNKSEIMALYEVKSCNF